MTSCQPSWWTRTNRLAFDNIGWCRTNENLVFRCLWRHLRPLETQINMAQYGSCCKQREELVVKPHSNSWESIPWTSWSTVSIFRHIYFCHERTTMTKNTIFVRFHFTPCSMLTEQTKNATYFIAKTSDFWICSTSCAPCTRGNFWNTSLAFSVQRRHEMIELEILWRLLLNKLKCSILSLHFYPYTRQFNLLTCKAHIGFETTSMKPITYVNFVHLQSGMTCWNGLLRVWRIFSRYQLILDNDAK